MSINHAIAYLIAALFVMCSGAQCQINLQDYASLDVSKFIIAETNTDVLYWIQVKNTGQMLLKDVELIDRFPDGIEYADSEVLSSFAQTKLAWPNKRDIPVVREYNWSLGALQTGETRWIKMIAKKDERNHNASSTNNMAYAKGKAIGMLVTSAPAKAMYPEVRAKDLLNQPSISGFSWLDVSSIFLNPILNQKADYIITVRNSGTNILLNVGLVANLSNKLNFLKSIPPSLNTPVPEDTNQTLYWQLGTLLPGDKKDVLLIAAIKKEEKIQDKDLSATRVFVVSFSENMIFDGYKSSVRNDLNYQK